MSETISQERLLSAAELSEQLNYETLLADLSASFVNLSVYEVDGNIETAQRRICECLGLDHASLWQTSQSEPGILLLTHLYRDDWRQVNFYEVSDTKSMDFIVAARSSDER